MKKSTLSRECYFSALLNVHCLTYFVLFQVEEYAKKLQPLLIETGDGLVLVPELYFVPRDKVHCYCYC